MMKLRYPLTAALLALLLAACSSNQTPPNASSAPAATESALGEAPEGSVPEEQPAEADTGFAVHTDHLTMAIEVDQEAYGHNAVINTRLTITNTGDQIIAYVTGSGSNVKPDALGYNLGDLADLFHPAMMTMDYRTDILVPGATLELELPFVPYRYTGEEDSPRIGLDKDIEFFQSEDFEPAEAGTVSGKAVFEYKRLPPSAELGEQMEAVSADDQEGTARDDAQANMVELQEWADENPVDLSAFDELPTETVELEFAVTIA